MKHGNQSIVQLFSGCTKQNLFTIEVEGKLQLANAWECTRGNYFLKKISRRIEKNQAVCIKGAII